MAEQRSDDLLKSREEAALLLRLDPTNLSPSDVLRCDLVGSLRLVVDDASATVLDGRAPDLARLLTATETLIKLLPSEPPKPTDGGDHDPRQVMWEIYKTMRERGELGLKPLSPDEEHDAKVAELEAEIARLKAGSALALLDNQCRGRGIDVPTSDITPPGERAECDAGPRAGPDDPHRRSAPLIEGKAVPPAPAARAAPPYDYNVERGWRDHVLPSGEITPTPFGGSRRWWGPV